MNQSIALPQTDAQLVAQVAALDPELAHRVQLRLRSLRLRLIPHILAEAQQIEPRHSVWQSLRWPWRLRG